MFWKLRLRSARDAPGSFCVSLRLKHNQWTVDSRGCAVQRGATSVSLRPTGPLHTPEVALVLLPCRRPSPQLAATPTFPRFTSPPFSFTSVESRGWSRSAPASVTCPPVCGVRPAHSSVSLPRTPLREPQCVYTSPCGHTRGSFPFWGTLNKASKSRGPWVSPCRGSPTVHMDLSAPQVAGGNTEARQDLVPRPKSRSKRRAWGSGRTHTLETPALCRRHSISGAKWPEETAGP